MRKLLALLLVLPLLGGCAVWGPEGGPNGVGIAKPSAVATTPTATDAILGADGVQRVTITVTDRLRFEPSEVRANVGTIEFTIRNTGGSPHTFGVGADKLDNINGGETRTLRVTVDRPGSYPYPCAYHGSVGMRGTLDVR
ncbi:cupredoxin domain-containing protein [Longispora sp. K20-0274]|uniref:cupredoxin domain-containing protein n=1 Tax=Longispora sp. K20-0274 TaxID=3088255 RepID=UPI00399B2D38